MAQLSLSLKSIFVTFAILIGTQYYSNGQLTKHEDFFKTKGKEYKTWLKSNGLNSTLNYKSIVVEEDLVMINLSAPSSFAWLTLNEKVVGENKGGDLSFMLWSELVFLGQLKPTEGIIRVDAKDVVITIEYYEDELLTDVKKTMGAKIEEDKAKSDVLKVEKSELNLNNTSSSASTVKNTTIKASINTIVDSLKVHFKKFEAKYTLENYSFEKLPYGKNYIKLRIKNIKYAVYDGQFEFLVFSFYFSEDDNDLNIKYSIGCEYGGGILWSPRNGDYKDGWVKFPKKTKQFCEDMKSKIYGILTDSK